MDMISFGPTIRGAHSPDERAGISSSQNSGNFWWKFKKYSCKASGFQLSLTSFSNKRKGLILKNYSLLGLFFSLFLFFSLAVRLFFGGFSSRLDFCHDISIWFLVLM
jgi:hypothetical protein